jgi:hypothetical protein
MGTFTMTPAPLRETQTARRKQICDFVLNNPALPLSAVGKIFGVSRQRVLMILQAEGADKRKAALRDAWIDVKQKEAEELFRGTGLEKLIVMGLPHREDLK